MFLIKVYMDLETSSQYRGAVYNFPLLTAMVMKHKNRLKLDSAQLICRMETRRLTLRHEEVISKHEI
jgi:hypothetical protein